MTSDEALSYIKNISVVLIAFLSLLFPLFFLTTTTDVFMFPKQLLALAITIILLLLFFAKSFFQGRIVVKTSPFNIPLAILAVVILASSLLSRNMYDSIIQATPVLSLFVLYFLIINSIEDRVSFRIALFSLLLGGILTSVIAILHFFKVYIFPFQVTQNTFFNTHGSLIQELIYLIPLLALSLYVVYRELRHNKNTAFDYNFGFYTIASVVMTVGVLLVVYQIFSSPQKPIMLPFTYGFQIALAAISQDAQRLIPSFLLGSGYGTYNTVFTRFRLPSFNLEKDIWSLVFSYSSSYYLELVATTGLLGALSFLYLVYKVFKTKTNKSAVGLYLSVLLLLLLTFLLPFSFSTLFLLFVLLAFYTSELYVEKKPYVSNVSLSLVTFKEGLFSLSSSSAVERKNSKILPLLFGLIAIVVSAFVGFYAVKLYIADSKVRESFDPANLSNGGKTFNLQQEALNTFPYKSDYHRIFSQVNFALANSLLNTLPAGSNPSADVQRQVFLLIQNSINEGRNASIIAPMTAVNWESLSQVYRNLINVGQNAEQFALATLQQAIVLDPSNPQLYIELGGIYYQLGQYENAQNQFQIAISLKRDFSNGYYNLGHALESKGDLQNALIQYQVTRELVKDNPDSFKRISAEIDTLEKKIGNTASAKKENTVLGAQTQQGPLELSSPSASIPAQKEPLKIPPPPGTKVSPAAPKPTAVPSPTPGL